MRERPESRQSLDAPAFHARRADTLSGDHALAAASFQEALALQRQLGNRRSVGDNLLSLGFLAFQRGDIPTARARISQALDIFAEQSYRPMLARPIEAIAFTAAPRGLATEAATLFGAAEAFREHIGVPMPPAYHHLYQQALGAITATLASEAKATAWAAGRALSVEQAVHRAHALCEGT